MTDAPKRSDQFLRRLLYTITKGSSPVSYKKQDILVKHFTVDEQGHIEEAYFKAFEKAKEQGLDTEAQCYKFLEEEGIWTREEENDLTVQKDYLESLEATRKSLAVPSQIDDINRDIKDAAAKVEKIEIKKKELLPQTCEHYASKKSHDLLVYYSFYEDEALSRKLFSWEEYCELAPEDLRILFDIYSEVSEELTMDNIKHLALSDFFTLYSTVLGYKNMHELLGKPIIDHTFYQLHLLNYARVFGSILENVSNIPDNVKSDPDLLLDFAKGASKADELREKSREKAGYSVVGATRQEMRDMGIDDGLGVDLHALAQKKGGKLTMEDFANLS